MSFLDLNWFLQFAFTILLISFGFIFLVKNRASKLFDSKVPTIRALNICVVCGISSKNCCSSCKSVRYCSRACQTTHWNTGHKSQCMEFKLAHKTNLKKSFGKDGIALVPHSGSSKLYKQSRKILFPYDEFLELFNCSAPGFPPCGLLNCGNSCFVNVVLQCLSFTQPLVAYLLEKGHLNECMQDNWCFLCEFQKHVKKVSQSPYPFAPSNILSQLPNIGSHFGPGKQEDAHEFMRFSIDMMQTACLDEFGGEKAVDPHAQETSLLQHIYGGHLQSQVICLECNKISNQYENMMDLTVEIQGDAASLEECLNQFTARESLHGENMYKCDGCNDYVKASKCLTIQHAPNILTIALKRFQRGMFGKLNKRISFPESLDLTSYMSEPGNGTDMYKLYAVVVHLDLLNAAYFGHYICYIKDFRNKWYRIDDDKVKIVELEEVLSQGAYMLLYSRISARPDCLYTIELCKNKDPQIIEMTREVDVYQKQPNECYTTVDPCDLTEPMNVGNGNSDSLLSKDMKVDNINYNNVEEIDHMMDSSVAVSISIYSPSDEKLIHEDTRSANEVPLCSSSERNIDTQDFVIETTTSGVVLEQVSASGYLENCLEDELVRKIDNAQIDYGSNCTSGLVLPSDVHLNTCVDEQFDSEAPGETRESLSPECMKIDGDDNCGAEETVLHGLNGFMSTTYERNGPTQIHILNSLAEENLYVPFPLKERSNDPVGILRERKPGAYDEKMSKCNGFAYPGLNHQISSETNGHTEVHSNGF